jgi:hypothetical protein
MSSQDEPEGLIRARAYRKELASKIELKEPLSLREKRFLLRTYDLSSRLSPSQNLSHPQSATASG